MKGYTCFLLGFLLIPTITLGQYVGTLELTVTDKLHTDVQVTLSYHDEKNDSIDITNSYSLLVLPLPYSLPDSYEIKAASDVKVSLMSSGKDFTILAIIAPSVKSTRFTIERGYELSENPEGKSMVRIDPSFPFITQPERDLFLMNNTVQSLKFIINLPKEYDETEVVVSSNYVIKIDKEKYSFGVFNFNNGTLNKEWMVFPNPVKSRINLYQLIFALLVGFFTLAFHSKATKNRNITWILIVFILSSIIVGIFIYFIVSVAKPLDIMVWSAAAIPHAIYGFVTSIYIFISKKFQSNLTGQVTIDNHPAQIAQVELYRIESGQTKKVSTKHELDDKGRFTFSRWQKKGQYKYYIKAKMHMSDEVETNEIEITRGEKIEIVPINLTSAQVISDDNED